MTHMHASSNPSPIRSGFSQPPIYTLSLGLSHPPISLRESAKNRVNQKRERREEAAMGEKQGKEEKKENKGEKKAEDKDNKGEAKESNNNKGGGKKEDGGPITVVLKLDIHCEGCALKIKKSVKNFDGVDAVSTDMANNKLTVIGRVDPWKIRDRVESKTRKKVDLIYPANAPKKESAPKDSESKKGSDSKDQKKPDEKKAKEPVASTVVLKIRLHCEGCIQRIRRTMLKVKGVETVNIDAQKDTVTVKGTMDANALPGYLKDKLKRSVEVVPQKKEGGGGGGEKKEKGGEGGGDKKEKGGEKGGDGGGGGGSDKKGKEGGGDKKEGGKKDEGGDQKQAAPAAPGGAPVAMEVNKMEYYGSYTPYHIEMVHAPQMFSDENPNACSIM